MLRLHNCHYYHVFLLFRIISKLVKLSSLSVMSICTAASRCPKWSEKLLLISSSKSRRPISFYNWPSSLRKLLTGFKPWLNLARFNCKFYSYYERTAYLQLGLKFRFYLRCFFFSLSSLLH